MSTLLNDRRGNRCITLSLPIEIGANYVADDGNDDAAVTSRLSIISTALGREAALAITMNSVIVVAPFAVAPK